MNDDILELITKINKFRDDRNWRQFHNPKDLAISLNLEASELLENFQWKDSQEALDINFDNIKDELADVLIYSLMLASDLNIDVAQIINNKIEKNNKKYPVEKSKDHKEKYTELD